MSWVIKYKKILGNLFHVLLHIMQKWNYFKSAQTNVPMKLYYLHIVELPYVLLEVLCVEFSILYTTRVYEIIYLKYILYGHMPFTHKLCYSCSWNKICWIFKSFKYNFSLWKPFAKIISAKWTVLNEEMWISKRQESEPCQITQRLNIFGSLTMTKSYSAGSK